MREASTPKSRGESSDMNAKDMGTKPEITKQQAMAAATAIGGLVPLTFYEGYVIKKLWNWFVPDVIPSVREINVAEAIGLSSMTVLFVPTPQPPRSKTKKGELPPATEMLAPITVRTSIVTLAWLFGAISKRYVRKGR
jgi:hypothetical protein